MPSATSLEIVSCVWGVPYAFFQTLSHLFPYLSYATQLTLEQFRVQVLTAIVVENPNITLVGPPCGQIPDCQVTLEQWGFELRSIRNNRV